MIIKQLNESYCKTYLIMNGKDNRAILIDPIINIAEDYIKILKDNGWLLTHVIDTHTHADHISAGPILREQTRCEYIMHREAPAECVSHRVEDGEILNINEIKIKVLHTPGHTKDSVSLILDEAIFTGDVLFLDDGGAGRDDLPGGNQKEHWESLLKIRNLPDDLMVYPAHDYGNREPSLLGRQKSTNPNFRLSDIGEYLEYIDNLNLGPEDWMKDVLKANYQCSINPEAAYIPEDNKACEIKGMPELTRETEQLKYIEAKELAELIDNKSEEILLLDIREKHELTEELGHLDGIINIPLGSLMMRIKELEKYKTKKIIVICRSGTRSKKGAIILENAGFEKVLVLNGGMISWRRK